MTSAVTGLTFLVALAASGLYALDPTYKVEVLFVVDKAVVDKYEAKYSSSALDKLNAEADYFITEINKIFIAISGFDVGVMKRDVIVLDQNLFDGPNVERDQGLKDFDEWRKDKGINDQYGQDVAVLWTGLELVRSGDPATAGYANVGAICNIETSSLVGEYDLTYNTVLVTAHEIGHVLGSGHDSTNTGKVMGSEASASSENRWFFSDESVSSMSSATHGCLQDTNGASEFVFATIPEELTDPDTVCRRAQNDDASYMCKHTAFYMGQVAEGDTICRSFKCWDTDSTKAGYPDLCFDAYASDGMVCEPNKRCYEGKCVEDSDAISAAVTNGCVYGNQPHLDFSTYVGHCDSMIADYGIDACLSMWSVCCDSCVGYYKKRSIDDEDVQINPPSITRGIPVGTPPSRPEGTPPSRPEGTPPSRPEGTPPSRPEGTPPSRPEGTPPSFPQGTPPSME